MRSADRAALGPALLALVAAVHLGYEPLAAGWPDPVAAARAIFYVGRGFEGAVLYAVVWAMSSRGLAVTVACAWGFVESAQTAVCRLAVGIGNRPVPSPYGGMCDVAAGWPVYGMTAALVLVALAFMQEADRDVTTTAHR